MIREYEFNILFLVFGRNINKLSSYKVKISSQDIREFVGSGVLARYRRFVPERGSK